MMLPAGDNANVTARIEKLEKSSSLITPAISTSPAVTQSAPLKEAKSVKEVVDKIVDDKPVVPPPIPRFVVGNKNGVRLAAQHWLHQLLWSVCHAGLPPTP
jgi:hypothetical protein